MRLRDDVPPPEPIESFAVAEPDPETLRDFLDAQAFKSLLAKMGVTASAASSTAPAMAEKEATEYELVQDEAALDRWIAKARLIGAVAVDTETTSLDALRADLVGVSLSVTPGKACYIPAGAPGERNAWTWTMTAAAERRSKFPCRPRWTNSSRVLADPSVLKIGQNIKYDMEVLSGHGVEVTPIDDTMVLSYVLDGGLHGHGMDELAQLHLGVQTIKYSEVCGTGRNQITFDRVPLDKALNYAAEDADVTLALHRFLKQRLVAEHMVTVYETIERPLIPVLTDMERLGVLVDAKVLTELSKEFARRMTELEAEIHQLAGRSFNVGSPKQLGEILFDEMSIQGGKKGKTGAYATGADVLEGLAAEGHDMPARVLDWRQLAKLKSTYADALIEQINPDTGRVHTSYAQTIAATGRLSSSDPNLQNIPIRTEEGRKIRRAFIAAPGHVLLSADYSQIELRLLAHVADIVALKDAFRDGMDIHAMTASQVFGVPVEGMDPMVRRRAKAINFGIIYGISAFGLARQLGIPRGEAGDYIKALLRALSGHCRLYGSHQETGTRTGLRHHLVRPQVPRPRHQRQERVGSRVRRARRHQRADPRRRRRHHQAGDDSHSRCVARRRAVVGADAVAGP